MDTLPEENNPMQTEPEVPSSHKDDSSEAESFCQDDSSNQAETSELTRRKKQTSILSNLTDESEKETMLKGTKETRMLQPVLKPTETDIMGKDDHANDSFLPRLPIEIPEEVTDIEGFKNYLTTRRGALSTPNLKGLKYLKISKELKENESTEDLDLDPVLQEGFSGQGKKWV